jgi:hypothetical protein
VKSEVRVHAADQNHDQLRTSAREVPDYKHAERLNILSLEYVMIEDSYVEVEGQKCALRAFSIRLSDPTLIFPVNASFSSL